jgi:hypothetical protein
MDIKNPTKARAADIAENSSDFLVFCPLEEPALIAAKTDKTETPTIVIIIRIREILNPGAASEIAPVAAPAPIFDLMINPRQAKTKVPATAAVIPA